MNFISALLHANIGYGIRRKAWHEKAVLYLEQTQLFWMDDAKKQRTKFVEPQAGKSNEVRLCGPDLTFDLQPEDFNGIDWEVI